MKFKRICVSVIVIACLIGFGVWAKLSNEKPVGQPGGNAQHTFFYDTKGPEGIKGITWEKEYDENRFPKDLVLYKDKVLCFNTDSVVCLEAASGKELWRNDYQNDKLTLDSTRYSFSASACYDGIVYFSKGENILGLDLESGVEKWNYKQEFEFNINTLMVQDSVIYYGSQDGALHALNIKDKRERWKLETQNEIINVAIEKGAIFVNTERNLIAANLKNGKELWKTDVSNFGGLTVGEKYIFLKGTSMGMVETELTAFDKKTGKEVWSYKPEKQEELIYDKIAYKEGRVFIITYTMDKNNYFIINSTIRAIDENNGKELWNFKEEKIMFSGLVVSKSGLYSCASDGQFIKLNPKNGTKETAMDIKSQGILSPVIKDGKLYFIGNTSFDDNGKWFFGKAE